MAHHDDNHNHVATNKPVAFTVPLILGIVTVFIILLFVSLGDPGHHECACKENCSKECMEACEKGDHSKHPEGMKHEEEGHKPEGATMSNHEGHPMNESANQGADSTHTEAHGEGHAEGEGHGEHH